MNKIESKEDNEIRKSFKSILGIIEDKRFGQPNQPNYFGWHEVKKGVQWNVLIIKNKPEIRIGVNLEGMKFPPLNWPITDFITRELEKPTINELKSKLQEQDKILIRFTRDAWQCSSRPSIIEQYINKDTSMTDMEAERWATVLIDALDCLNNKNHYRGRGAQEVTFTNSGIKQTMEVTPHLYISTRIETNGDIDSRLKKGITRLKPVHEWVTRQTAKLPH